jgi:tetratricopeptide (TPR) repeat protein
MYFKGNRFIRWTGIVITALLPMIPIKENYYNQEQIRIVGGAEQNGHDYGWQFGNYQLRGANAINEELAKDEEPLPNPVFPPEMGPSAVFFGGTDPGRFVPTYMIYSAKVREDVYLITQNALADNTYMNVMRDLYGNSIWIPAQPDSAGAFTRYVDDVKAGRRPPNADIKIENGRVQISGAMGVMEINGILAQMIFEHNNYKHDFYVEESYIIRWMYPYMEPHGLIMKINKDIQPRISPQRINDDLDFWDWYTRRLTSDNMFRRDIVARKSFSKLRSAIAGLYVFCNERRPEEAERAFHESRLLYPLSPEANFRLAELYMMLGRTVDVKRLISGFGRQDPGNRNVPEFLGHVGRTEQLTTKIRELEGRMKGGGLNVEAAFELSECYFQLGQPATAATILDGILAASNLPAYHCLNVAKLMLRAGRTPEMNKAIDMCTNRMPSNAPVEAYIDIARLYAQSGQLDKMGRTLEQYLRIQPNDWKAWLDLASIQIGMKQTNDASRSLEQALRCGGQQAMTIVNQDPRFRPIPRMAGPKTKNIMDLLR